MASTRLISESRSLNRQHPDSRRGLVAVGWPANVWSPLVWRQSKNFGSLRLPFPSKREDLRGITLLRAEDLQNRKVQSNGSFVRAEQGRTPSLLPYLQNRKVGVLGKQLRSTEEDLCGGLSSKSSRESLRDSLTPTSTVSTESNVEGRAHDLHILGLGNLQRPKEAPSRGEKVVLGQGRNTSLT